MSVQEVGAMLSIPRTQVLFLNNQSTTAVKKDLLKFD